MVNNSKKIISHIYFNDPEVIDFLPTFSCIFTLVEIVLQTIKLSYPRRLLRFVAAFYLSLVFITCVFVSVFFRKLSHGGTSSSGNLWRAKCGIW